MREVAWVVFDEIHYMRDKSKDAYHSCGIHITNSCLSPRCSLGGNHYPAARQS